MKENVSGCFFLNTVYVCWVDGTHPRLKDVISKLCKILFISVTSAKTLDVS